MIRSVPAMPLAVVALLLAACGAGAGTLGTTPTADTTGVAPGGGDIPDNQVYLTYTASGFSIKYPEGWVRTVQPSAVTFDDKDNRISVVIRQAPVPTVDSVRSAVRALSGSSTQADAHPVSLPAGTAIAITYQVDGAADAVTGKRPRLTVDRYEVGRSGQLAVVELAGRVGTDNVDAYRLIAQSFQWR